MSDVNVKAPPNNHMTDVIALDIADAMTALGHDDAGWLLKHDPNALMQRVADELHQKSTAVAKASTCVDLMKCCGNCKHEENETQHCAGCVCAAAGPKMQ